MAIADLGADGIAQVMRARSPRLSKTLPAKILTALDEQSVVVAGTDAFGRVITGVAAQLSTVRAERDRLGVELEERLDAHPLAQVLTSMPGLGFRTAIKILTIIGDGSAFATAAHLASYAGLAPVTRRSGTSIRGESHSRRGNHALKNALFLSAFAALVILTVASTTTTREPRAGATTLLSSVWLAAVSTSCSPCSVITSPTGLVRPLSRPDSPSLLDQDHRDTPPLRGLAGSDCRG